MIILELGESFKTMKRSNNPARPWRSLTAYFSEIIENSDGKFRHNQSCFKFSIQYIIFEDLQIKINNKNSSTLFFDIVYYTTITYEDLLCS